EDVDATTSGEPGDGLLRLGDVIFLRHVEADDVELPCAKRSRVVTQLLERLLATAGGDHVMTTAHELERCMPANPRRRARDQNRLHLQSPSKPRRMNVHSDVGQTKPFHGKHRLNPSLRSTSDRFPQTLLARRDRGVVEDDCPVAAALENASKRAPNEG